MSVPCPISCGGNITPVMAYLGVLSRNVQWNLRRLLMATAWRNPNFGGGKKIRHLKMVTLNVMTSGFTASNFSERYRDGHGNKCIL